MASRIPFQDLNPLSDPIISPKIEPKLEPLDDQIYFPNPNPNFQQEISPFPEIAAEENEVFSEFFRNSQILQLSFTMKMQRYGDLEVSDPNALAVVPQPEFVPQAETMISSAVVATKKTNRSAELVRLTNVCIEDQRYFRDLMRWTRMVYDSLRIFSTQEDHKAKSLGEITRLRGNLRAASIMMDRGLWLNRDKRIVGSIPGVYIGDLFFFRMELCVIGLHGQTQAGIDYVPAGQSSTGEPIATSVIVSGGYEDDEDTDDVIIYTGHGGQDRRLARQCVHQKLEGGNLALERSSYYGIEVRVIRGIKYEGSTSGKVYVYDGLYKVLDSWFDVGKSGFGVYKYKLVRIGDQPEMGSAVLKLAQNLKTRPLSTRPFGYLSTDISIGKEDFPVLLFNDIDSDREPMSYEYIVRPVYPTFVFQQGHLGMGCDCVTGCSDGCCCAWRNGGEFSYDRNGILVRGKPLIFECGMFCSCPASCLNRVSQKGLKNQLEVFRSRETGWGVRSLDLIPAGSFICEYNGIVLTKEQTATFKMNGDSLVHPNRFTNRWMEWGDLSQVFPEYDRPMYPSTPPLNFAMDVSRMRNVACYMSHSSSPNVLVQFVLYDHHNPLYPHLMLFAMENIPPLRELSLEYGVAGDW